MSERRTIRLLRDSFPEPPALDTAVSRTILERVSAGQDPETIRIHRPGAVVAFGPRDRLAPGFTKAVAAAQDHGFASVHRLAGGRAAVFHEGTIAFSWVIPDATPKDRITARFEEISGIIAAALRSLGVDARIGEIPGEYCPGAHSVNAGGRTKLVGVGQRIVQNAAHVGGVIVVSGADRIRDVLIPVYEALELPWDPATVGSLEDELGPIDWDEAVEALIVELSKPYTLGEVDLDAETITRANDVVSSHEVVAAD